jgi:hypothetical protein
MNRINNYNDLLAEKLRLENKILEQKQNLKKSITEIKEKLAPLLFLLPILSFLKKSKSSGLMKTSVSLGIDWLVGHKFLSKSSWLVKLLVPRVLKQSAGSIIPLH